MYLKIKGKYFILKNEQDAFVHNKIGGSNRKIEFSVIYLIIAIVSDSMQTISHSFTLLHYMVVSLRDL